MKYRIAIFGTFDVENYGDLLFPDVFKLAMEKRGLEFEYFLFSPVASGTKALDDTTKVYPAIDFMKIHREKPIDAIIIGGGALIHYYSIPVKMPGQESFSEYRILDSWLVPLHFAATNGIKVFFNLPQVPYQIEPEFSMLTCNALSLADKLSFRDETSADFIRKAFELNNIPCPEISVVPDSVCGLSDLIDKGELLQLSSKFIHSNNYAVVQFNPQKPESEDKDLCNLIKNLQSRDYQVVLLPLGYTHNDDYVLTEFNSKYNLNCILPDHKLSIFEMAAVLAGCKIYFGSSFHGALTSVIYGNVAVSYNYIHPKTKNRTLMSDFGISDFVCETAYDGNEILDKYFNGELKYLPNIEFAKQSVAKHFDTIFDAITDGNARNKEYNDSLYPPLFQSICDYARLLNVKINLDNQITALNEQLNQQNERINSLQQQLNDKNNELNSVLSSTSWKVTKPLRGILDTIKK